MPPSSEPRTRLAGRTTLGIGGVPERFLAPAGEEEAGELLATQAAAGVAVRVLGGGSNLLIDDGVLDGAVLSTHRLRRLVVHADRVEVGAGYPFAALVARAALLRIPVLSGCVGIPGSCGGAVAMNAGGRFGTTGDALLEVRGFGPLGEPYARRVGSGDLAYRRSVFARGLITTVVFRRDLALDPIALRERYEEARASKRRSQPLSEPSAGCIFRNPEGEGSPSAGTLIEEAGLKGFRVGGAEISRLHANFIVNRGGATSSDVVALIERVRREVRARFDVTLHLEVVRWLERDPSDAARVGSEMGA